MKQYTKNRYESLEKFDAAHAPEGMLVRYVNGRARTIWLRLIVAMVGCVFLMFAVSPVFGMMIAAITLPLELLEFWILKRWVTDRKYHPPWTTTMVSLASGLQVFGIGMSIFLTGIQSADLRIVAWSFLLGAVLNSMLAAQYHSGSNAVRLWVLCLSGIFVLLETLGQGQLTGAQAGVEFGALFAMGAMLYHLFAHLARRESRMQQAERELIHRSVEAEQLALVAEHASDSILLMNPEMAIEWVNPQFTNVTGFSSQYAVGHTPGELLNHPDTSEDSISRLITAAREKKSVNLRILNQARDSRAIWIETHQTPVIGDDGEVKAFIAVERDVTDLVAREKQLRLALNAAKEADHEKAAFLSRMSHELHGPANGILGGMEILRETEVCALQSDALDILDSSAKRLMTLVENLVTMAGMQSGAITTHFEEVRIRDVMSAVLVQHREEAEEKGVLLLIHVDQSAACAVLTDYGVVHGVLDKLVDNAVKFTPAGQVEIRARIEQDGWLHVSVEDTGVGIPNDKVSEIFEAFEQVDDVDTRKFDGAGLGLATVKNLAALLGGRIRVSSQLGKGSRFKMKIPVQLASMAAGRSMEHVPVLPVDQPLSTAPVPVPEATVKDPPCANTKDQMRLLVAEDNRTNQMLIKSMLKSAGHTIDFAEDGVQAVAQYIENRPDFVLMDLSMLNKNGLDATREIRTLKARDHLRRCPIVAVTANVTDDDRKKCFDAGMDAFLPKPLKKDVLLDTIVENSV